MNLSLSLALVRTEPAFVPSDPFKGGRSLLPPCEAQSMFHLNGVRSLLHVLRYPSIGACSRFLVSLAKGGAFPVASAGMTAK